MVSIPYGAIKSFFEDGVQKMQFQFLTVRLKVSGNSKTITQNTVSIPYGAIKSIFFITSKEVRSKFQFLTVRLKASFKFFSNSRIIVSIPYGAIKSVFKFHLLE